MPKPGLRCLVTAVGVCWLLVLSACLPGDPYPSGYIVDAGGVLVLRGIPCKDGQSLHFTSVDVYPSSAVHGWDKFDGKPVWSARSKRGIGAVLLGDAEQPGLTVVRAGALAAPTRYQVWYSSRELGPGIRDEVDLRIADLSDGETSSALGMVTERNLLRQNPAAFGCG